MPFVPGPVRRPFHETLGIEVIEAWDGRARVRMADDPRLGNARGDVHGGAIAGLLDAALAAAARSNLPVGYSTATVAIATNFVAPGRGALVAEGRVLRSGRTIVSVEADARDGAGVLVAHAIGTMRVLRPHVG
jgi:uncharacterized protein (TIGR00369 family)